MDRLKALARPRRNSEDVGGESFALAAAAPKPLNLAWLATLAQPRKRAATDDIVEHLGEKGTKAKKKKKKKRKKSSGQSTTTSSAPVAAAKGAEEVVVDDAQGESCRNEQNVVGTTPTTIVVGGAGQHALLEGGVDVGATVDFVVVEEEDDEEDEDEEEPGAAAHDQSDTDHAPELVVDETGAVLDEKISKNKPKKIPITDLTLGGGPARPRSLTLDSTLTDLTLGEDILQDDEDLLSADLHVDSRGALVTTADEVRSGRCVEVNTTEEEEAEDPRHNHNTVDGEVNTKDHTVSEVDGDLNATRKLLLPAVVVSSSSLVSSSGTVSSFYSEGEVPPSCSSSSVLEVIPSRGSAAVVTTAEDGPPVFPMRNDGEREPPSSCTSSSSSNSILSVEDAAAPSSSSSCSVVGEISSFRSSSQERCSRAGFSSRGNGEPGSGAAGIGRKPSLRLNELYAKVVPSMVLSSTGTDYWSARSRSGSGSAVAGPGPPQGTPASRPVSASKKAQKTGIIYVGAADDGAMHQGTTSIQGTWSGANPWANPLQAFGTKIPGPRTGVAGASGVAAGRSGGGPCDPHNKNATWAGRPSTDATVEHEHQPPGSATSSLASATSGGQLGANHSLMIHGTSTGGRSTSPGSSFEESRPTIGGLFPNLVGGGPRPGAPVAPAPPSRFLMGGRGGPPVPFNTRLTRNSRFGGPPFHDGGGESVGGEPRQVPVNLAGTIAFPASWTQQNSVGGRENGGGPGGVLVAGRGTLGGGRGGTGSLGGVLGGGPRGSSTLAAVGSKLSYGSRAGVPPRAGGPAAPSTKVPLKVKTLEFDFGGTSKPL